MRREGCKEDSYKGERPILSRGASCKRAHGHVVKRIVFVVVALKGDALALVIVIDHNRSIWLIPCPSECATIRGYILRVLQFYPQTTLGVVLVPCDSERRLAGMSVCFLTIGPIKSRVHRLSDEQS